VAQAFREEQPRLLPLPLHLFNTDRIETVRSRKTIYVHFDLNDYSIPPEAVGRTLTLVASDTEIRSLDGAAEIANCSLTTYELDRGALALRRFNFVAPLTEEGAPVTAEPDATTPAK